MNDDRKERGRDALLKAAQDLDESTRRLAGYVKPSPFKTHRHLLLNEDYSTACSLQEFVLSLYNGATTQFRADALSNYDADHVAIFVEFAKSYYRHGENDEEFMSVCRRMWAQRKRWGVELLERLEAHKQIDPEHYQEGSASDWREQRDWLERQVEAYQAKGWIE